MTNRKTNHKPPIQQIPILLRRDWEQQESYWAIAGWHGVAIGGMAGNTIAEVVEEVAQELKPTLEIGANNKAIELPRHSSWTEL